MLLYIVDDRGSHGEYANFLRAYEAKLPPFDLHVFTHWNALYDAVTAQPPDGILADMRFDEPPSELLYGDIQKLADTDRFCGNLARAEAQIRGMQGLMIIQALREKNILIPALLFAPFNDNVRQKIISQVKNLDIIDGLRFNEIKLVLQHWSECFNIIS